MRHIKTYQVFEASASAALTAEQKIWLDECARGTWKLNRQTGLVDVDGNFKCEYQSLQDFKGVKFGKVSENFYCNNNQLTSLVGAPEKVVGFFWGMDNQLTTLKGAPHSVGSVFYCHRNQLTTLVGAPHSVGKSFECCDNALTSLEGAPRNVGERFNCSHNQLTSLVGAPQSVGDDFKCNNNQLTSLVGAPKTVGGYFCCNDNQLTTLVGAPQIVRTNFFCSDNPVSEKTLKTIFNKMKQGTSYLAAVESLWSGIPQYDQALLYADDFKWVSPEQSRGIIALRAYHDLRGML